MKYLCVGDESFYGLGNTLEEAYQNMKDSTSFEIEQNAIEFYEITPIKVKFGITKIEE